MQCPQCRHDAAESAKFCAECGAALAADAPDLRDPHWGRYVKYLHDRRVRRARVVQRSMLVGAVLLIAVGLVFVVGMRRGSVWPTRVASSRVEAPPAVTPDRSPSPADTRDSTPTAAPRVAESPAPEPPVTAPRVVEPPVAAARVAELPATAPPVAAPPVAAPPVAAPALPARPPLTPSARLPATAAAAVPFARAPLSPPASPPFEPPRGSSALPSIVGRAAAVAVGDLVIDVHSQARIESRGRIVDYTVHLARVDGTPVTDAQVALRGETPDGATVEARLDRMTTPGVYETAVVIPASGLHRLSLRITRPDTALELPIAPAPAS